MKRWVGILGLALIAVAGLAIGYTLRIDAGAVRYEVVRGDTLGEIATAHGVTVDELRRWNNLSGDLIEIGDILLIHAAGTAEDAPSARPSPRRPRPASQPTPKSEQALRMPPAKPCLAQPSGDGLGDAGAVASTGLSYDQIKASMDAFVPHTLRCVPDGTAGRIETKIVVGCNGLVSRVEIGGTGGMPSDVVACVEDTLRYAEFPAHSLPDGEVFEYPLSFSWD